MYQFGLFVFFISVPVSVMYSECREKDHGTIKRNCRRSGLNFDMAEVVENKTLVCECLVELFKCINRTLPNCVDKFKEKYIEFSYTPWDCHLLEDHITGGDDKCGKDVIFEVRFKENIDKPDIVHLDDETESVQESSDSCRTDVVLATYLMIWVQYLFL